MSQFDQSRWADSQFTRNFRNAADIYLPLRRQFIAITKEFYKHFIAHNTDISILDLGCGDGLFIQELLQSFTPAKIVLVDGSAEMLAAAGKRLGNQPNVTCIQTSFQELLNTDPLPETFDFIYSSLAIHHLPFAEKKNCMDISTRICLPADISSITMLSCLGQQNWKSGTYHSGVNGLQDIRKKKSVRNC